MKIAIDARGINWYKGTGIGTYTENLLNHLLTQDKNNFYYIFWSGKDPQNFNRKNSEILLTSLRNYSYFEEVYFSTTISEENIDLLHMPQNGIGLQKVSALNCKKIITIHDLIPYVMPETVGKGYLRKFLSEMPEIISAADVIITVSNYSKQDIIKFFSYDPDKIFVTPLAADEKYKPIDKNLCVDYLNKKYNIDKPFILYIGGFSQRKNVKNLLICFKNIYNKLSEEYNLVIVGASNKDQHSYLTSLGIELNISNHIIFTDFVAENDLPYFYNACEVFIYPSLYEGFGLPNLEAMSCGCPIISSASTSIPEVVGDSGILIDPYSEIELQDAILKIIEDKSLQEKLSLKGLERSKIFNWEKTAAETINAYNSLKL